VSVELTADDEAVFAAVVFTAPDWLLRGLMRGISAQGPSIDPGPGGSAVSGGMDETGHLPISTALAGGLGPAPVAPDGRRGVTHFRASGGGTDSASRMNTNSAGKAARLSTGDGQALAPLATPSLHPSLNAVQMLPHLLPPLKHVTGPVSY